MQIDGYSGKEVLYEEIIFPRNRQFLVTARRIRDLNVTQVILKEIDPIMNLQYQRRNVDEEYSCANALVPGLSIIFLFSQ